VAQDRWNFKKGLSLQRSVSESAFSAAHLFSFSPPFFTRVFEEKVPFQVDPQVISSPFFPLLFC